MNRLAQTRIAAFKLFAHRNLIRLDRGTVGREIHVHQGLRRRNLLTCSRSIVIQRQVVPYIQTVTRLVLAIPNHFIDIAQSRRRKQGMIVIVQLQPRLRHNRIGGIDSFLQEIIGTLILIVPRLIRRRIDLVIFTISTFEKTNSRFESQSYPTINHVLVSLRIGRTIRASEIQILQHFAHHIFAIVAAGIEQRIVDIEYMIDPRHIAERLHFAIIEISPPKTRYAFIMIINGL